MNKKFIECWTHPIKSKIYFEISTMGSATAKMITEKHPHIPQATLYRHLKGMVEDGVLKIAKERQVRNLTEKTYELALNIKVELAQYIEDNPKDNIAFLILESLAALQSDFSNYFQRDDANPLVDGLGLYATPFYATTDELKECASKLQEVMKPYFEAESTPERKLRNFVRIFTPPKDKS